MAQMNAFSQTIALEYGNSLLALAQANQRVADVTAKAAEDKQVYEASIKKLKDRIEELEAMTKPSGTPGKKKAAA